MSKENNHIDDLFKDAFDNWEDSPNKDIWNNIAENIDGNNENIDEMFKNAFSDEEVVPSEKVWVGVKEHLPLNLWLKRRLSKLSYVAGILVVGMMATMYMTQEKETEIMAEPIPVIKNVVPDYNIAVSIEEVEEVVAVKKVKKKRPRNKSLATDNTLNKKMISVELNKEDEMVFDIDEEKM